MVTMVTVVIVVMVVFRDIHGRGRRVVNGRGRSGRRIVSSRGGRRVINAWGGWRVIDGGRRLLVHDRGRRLLVDYNWLRRDSILDDMLKKKSYLWPFKARVSYLLQSPLAVHGDGDDDDGDKPFLLGYLEFLLPVCLYIWH